MVLLKQQQKFTLIMEDGRQIFFKPFESQTEKEINWSLTLHKFERQLSDSFIYCDLKVQSCKWKWKSKAEICHTASRSNEDFLTEKSCSRFSLYSWILDLGWPF